MRRQDIVPLTEVYAWEATTNRDRGDGKPVVVLSTEGHWVQQDGKVQRHPEDRYLMSTRKHYLPVVVLRAEPTEELLRRLPQAAAIAWAELKAGFNPALSEEFGISIRSTRTIVGPWVEYEKSARIVRETRAARRGELEARRAENQAAKERVLALFRELGEAPHITEGWSAGVETAGLTWVALEQVLQAVAEKREVHN